LPANTLSAQDGALVKGAEATRLAREELQQRISTVDAHVQQLGGRFKGQAAAAFNKLMIDWKDESAKITAALTEFEANLRSHQANLDAGEQDQSSAFSRIAARMGGN